ncbi:hypothetical protein BVRB_6g144460 [Beta vulgaris subsp. vulgaris]|nr:hypothetical protein BVRB_6g144460 [Beta vulgaris subsp. vulgaris]
MIQETNLSSPINLIHPLPHFLNCKYVRGFVVDVFRSEVRCNFDGFFQLRPSDIGKTRWR